MHTRRRDFLGGIAVATGGWPIAASGQRPGIPTVGFLNSGTAEAFEDRVAKFRQGLTETGYVEGQNVTVDYRFAEGRYERLPALAADLVRRGVKILVATGGDVAASAAA